MALHKGNTGAGKGFRPEKWPLVSDRVQYIQGLARGLDVMDVGCTGIRADGRIPEPATGLHQAIRQVSRSLLGVDVDPVGVKNLNDAGYRAVCADITAISIPEAFDLIVAGEIIEHLLNPGAALENLGRHLKKDGRLVLTTPNPFHYRQQSRILRKGRIKVHAEHTSWYDPVTLRALLSKTGFEIEQGAWIYSRHRSSFLGFLGKWRKYWNPNFLVVARLKGTEAG
jgi:SAM-dependent methyltransferase